MMTYLAGDILVAHVTLTFVPFGTTPLWLPQFRYEPGVGGKSRGDMSDNPIWKFRRLGPEMKTGTWNNIDSYKYGMVCSLSLFHKNRSKNQMEYRMKISSNEKCYREILVKNLTKIREENYYTSVCFKRKMLEILSAVPKYPRHQICQFAIDAVIHFAVGLIPGTAVVYAPLFTPSSIALGHMESSKVGLSQFATIAETHFHALLDTYPLADDTRIFPSCVGDRLFEYTDIT